MGNGKCSAAVAMLHPVQYRTVYSVHLTSNADLVSLLYLPWLPRCTSLSDCGETWPNSSLLNIMRRGERGEQTRQTRGKTNLGSRPFPFWADHQCAKAVENCRPQSRSPFLSSCIRCKSKCLAFHPRSKWTIPTEVVPGFIPQSINGAIGAVRLSLPPGLSSCYARMWSLRQFKTLCILAFSTNGKEERRCHTFLINDDEGIRVQRGVIVATHFTA